MYTNCDSRLPDAHDPQTAVVAFWRQTLCRDDVPIKRSRTAESSLHHRQHTEAVVQRFQMCER